MSRSGYSDDYDGEGQPIEFWQQAVRQAMSGKRGQKFLCDLRDAMDALPAKRLISGHLVDPDGEVCAIGSVGVRRGVDMSALIKPPDVSDEDWECDWECEAYERAGDLAGMFDIAPCLAQEVMYQNDECDLLHLNSTGEVLETWRGERPPSHYDTPEERWVRMRKWVARKLGETWTPQSSATSAGEKS